jgi:lysozyme family protein
MWPKYAAWWDRMAIKKDRVSEFEGYANYAIKHKDIYQEVKQTTPDRLGVHWYHVAVLHRRAESGNGGRLSPRSNGKDRGSPDPERPSAGCSIGRPDGSSVIDRR